MKEPKIVASLKVTAVSAAVGTKAKMKSVSLPTSSKKKTASTSLSVGRSNGIPKGTTMEDKILYACEFFYELGMTEPRRVEVAKKAGFASIETKTVRVCFQKNGPLAARGHVEFPSSDTIVITMAGLQSIGHDFDRRRSNDEMLDFIASLFNKSSHSELRVLDALSDGATYSVTELLTKTNYAREDTKAFREPIRQLKKGGYLEVTGSGGGKMYRLTDKAFPDGRP
jgi:hypothetical protein